MKRDPRHVRARAGAEPPGPRLQASPPKQAMANKQPAQSQIGELVIDISQFTSDESRRDNFIRRQGLESATYPQASFKTTSITGLPDKVAVGDQVEANQVLMVIE